MLLVPNLIESKDYKRLSQMLPAIKGVAIFMVVTYHIWGYSKVWTLSEISWGNGLKGLVEGLLGVFFLMGEHGVHLFLVVSGFGLATSWWRYYKTSGKVVSSDSVIPFWQRRVSRIFPLYWLAHGLALILALVNPNWVPFGKQFLGGGINAIAALFLSLTTLRNFFLDYYFVFNPAWWYIGLAVQLYFIFPLLVWVGKRWGWLKLLAGSLLISLVYRTIIIALPLNEQATDILLRGAVFPSRLFEFAFGIVLAISLLEGRSLRGKPSWRKLILPGKKFLFEYRWMGLAVLLWASGLVCHWASAQGWIILRIPADALIGVGEFSFFVQLLNLLPWLQTWLKPIGNSSYGTYLTHSNILRGLWTVLTPILASYWLRFGAVTLLCFLFGAWFEIIYNWIKNRFFVKKACIIP